MSFELSNDLSALLSDERSVASDKERPETALWDHEALPEVGLIDFGAALV